MRLDVARLAKIFRCVLALLFGSALWLMAAGAASAQTADLQITKTDGVATEIPGTSISYTIVASNPAGPDPAPGSTVTDIFPVTLTGISWTCSAAGGASCTGAGAGNINDLVNLPVGGSVTYTVNATIAPDATGTLTNTATVTPPGTVTESSPGNNTASDSDTLAPQGNLSITKTDGSATEVPGTTVTYTIVASNSGPSTVTGATIGDSFPATITGVTWSCVAAGMGSSCTGAGVNNILDSADIAPGGTVTYTATGTISETATGSLSNTATITAPGGFTDTGGANSATDTDTLNPQVNLGITKTDGVTTEIPGTSISYTIVVSNAGPSAVNNALVNDTFPATLQNVTWTCTPSGGSSCAAGSGMNNIATNVSLLVGGTATFVVNATIASSATGSLSNTATVTAPGGTTETAPANNTATDTDTLTPQADLLLTKSDLSDPVIAGTNLVYSVLIQNNGPSDAVSVGLVDTLPSQVTFVSSVPGGPTCTHSLGIVTCALGTLTASSSTTVTITVHVPSSVADGVTISNFAVASTSTTDPGPGSNADVETTLVEREPDLGITKTSPSPVIAGLNFDYSVVVENNGPSDASMVVVTDTLPNEVTFVAAPGCSHDGSPTGGVVTCNVGDLVAGATQTFTITVFLDPCTPKDTLLSNFCMVDLNPAENDPGPTPNSFTLMTLVDTQADLVITKSDSPDPVLAGNEVTYAITITNNGPSCAVNVVATDTMPPDVLFREGKSDPTCMGSTTVTCTEGLMTPGQVISLTITGKVECDAADGSIQTNTITVTSDTADPDGSDNTASTPTTVDTLSDISVVKTDAPDPVQPASLLTYNFDITNTGPSDANAVVLVDTLPAGLTYVSGSEGCSASGSTITCNVGVVPCEKVRRQRIRVRVETTNSPLLNAAAVSTATDEISTTNNSASASTTVRDSPRFLLRMSGAPRFLREGGVTTAIYQLRVQNKTLLGVVGAQLVDTLPAGLTFVESVPAPTAISGQVLTYDLSTLPPGGSQIILIKATLVPGTAAGTALVNTAVLSQFGTTVATETFTGGVRAPTNQEPGELSATLTTLRRVLAGSQLTSTIDINNSGRVEAQDVVVQLNAPSSLALESAQPSPTSLVTAGDETIATWSFDSLRGPGKKRIKLSHTVPNGASGGSVSLTVGVTDTRGRVGSDSATVEIR